MNNHHLNIDHYIKDLGILFQDAYNLARTLMQLVSDASNKLAIIRNTLMIYQKRTLLYCINNLCVQY